MKHVQLIPLPVVEGVPPLQRVVRLRQLVPPALPFELGKVRREKPLVCPVVRGDAPHLAQQVLQGCLVRHGADHAGIRPMVGAAETAVVRRGEHAFAEALEEVIEGAQHEHITVEVQDTSRPDALTEYV